MYWQRLVLLGSHGFEGNKSRKLMANKFEDSVCEQTLCRQITNKIMKLSLPYLKSNQIVIAQYNFLITHFVTQMPMSKVTMVVGLKCWMCSARRTSMAARQLSVKSANKMLVLNPQYTLGMIYQISGDWLY